MSTPHGSFTGSPDAFKRFFEQASGKAAREFPHGRMGADDDGAISFAIATDARHGVIRIQFPKPVEWIGLDASSAEHLRDELTARLLELRGIKSDG